MPPQCHLTYWLTFLFMKLHQWNLDHASSFACRFQLWYWLTLSLTYSPTFLLLKLQQWNWTLLIVLHAYFNFDIVRPWPTDLLYCFWSYSNEISTKGTVLNADLNFWLTDLTYLPGFEATAVKFEHVNFVCRFQHFQSHAMTFEISGDLFPELFWITLIMTFWPSALSFSAVMIRWVI